MLWYAMVCYAMVCYGMLPYVQFDLNLDLLEPRNGIIVGACRDNV